MSFNNINSDLPILASVRSEENARATCQAKKMLALGITLLVISTIVFLTGLGCLISGIVSSTSLLIIVGAGLMSGGVLGVLIASLLIGLAKHKKTIQLELENTTLRDLIKKSSDTAVQQDLQVELNKLANKLEDVKKEHQRDLRDKEEEINRLSGRIVTLDRLTTEKNELIRKCSSLENSETSLRERIRNLEEKEKTLREKFIKEEREKGFLREKIEVLETEAVFLKEQLIQDLECQDPILLKKLQELNRRFEDLQKETTLVEERMYKLEAENLQLKETLTAAMEGRGLNLENFNQKVRAIEEEKQSLTESLLLLKAELEVSEGVNKDLAQRLREEKGFLVLTEEKLQQLEEENQQLEEELEKAVKQAALASEGDDLELCSARELLKQAKLEFEAVKNKEKRLQERVVGCRASLATLNTRHLEILKSLRQAEAALEKINPSVVMAQAQREVQREAWITKKENTLKEKERELEKQGFLLLEKQRLLEIKEQELNYKLDSLEMEQGLLEREKASSRVILSRQSRRLSQFVAVQEVIEEESEESASQKTSEESDK